MHLLIWKRELLNRNYLVVELNQPKENSGCTWLRSVYFALIVRMLKIVTAWFIKSKGKSLRPDLRKQSKLGLKRIGNGGTNKYSAQTWLLHPNSLYLNSTSKKTEQTPKTLQPWNQETLVVYCCVLLCSNTRLY